MTYRKKSVLFLVVVSALASLFSFTAVFAATPNTSNSTSTNEWLMSGRTLDNNRYYNGTMNMTLLGKLWNLSIGHYTDSTPAVIDGILYIGCDDGKVYAINATTGAKIWNYTIGDYVRDSPAVANGIVYIGSDDGYLYALNATNGSQIWSYMAGREGWNYDHTIYGWITGYIDSPVIVSNGIAYVGADDDIFYAINATNGSLVWSYQASSAFFYSSAALANGIIYVGNLDNRVYALNATNGTQLWNYTTGYYISSSVSVAYGTVYVGSWDHKVYALNATNGSLIWYYTTGDDIPYASPAVANGIVYIGSRDDKFYALNATNGTQLWNYTTGNGIYTAPIVTSNDIVFIGSNDNKLYALNATTGSRLWFYPLPAAVTNSPSLANGTLFVGVNNKNIFAFAAGMDTVPTAALNSPAAAYTNASSPAVNVTFNCSATDDIQLSNITLYITNRQNQSFSANQTTNISVTSGSAAWTLELNIGNYTWNCLTTDNAGQTDWADANRSVQNTYVYPPVASTNTPADNYANDSAASISVLFNCSATDNNGLRNISLFLTNNQNESFSLNQTTNISGLSNSTNWTVTLAAGVYRWNCLFYDNETGTDWGDANRTLLINYTSPIPTSESTSITEWRMFGRTLNKNRYYPASVNMEDIRFLWNYTTGDYVFSSPAVVNGVLYIGSNDDNVYALNATNGSKIWNYTTGGDVDSSPAVAVGVVYVGSEDGNIYALNVSNGSKIWNYTTGGGIISSPAISDGILYVGSKSDKVFALNITNGTATYLWNYTTGNDVLSSPAVANGIVYIGSNDDTFYALNATNGSLIWSHATGCTACDIYSSPTVANGIVYIGSWNHNISAFNATTGVGLWNYTTGDRIMYSSPAILNGVLYIGGRDKKLYALNATNGSLIWNYTTGYYIYSSPTIANGMLFFGSQDNKMFVLNATTGNLIWNYSTGYYVDSSPAIVGGMVYIGCNDNKVYAFRGVPDDPSTWSNNQTNAAGAMYGSSIWFNTNWTDDYGIDSIIFSWNGTTGSWQNTTQSAGSATAYGYNATKTVNLTSGNVVGWRFYANDTAGNWNASDIFTFTVAATPGSDGCGTLGSASGTYTLTSNINTTSTCFTMNASNITLNCAGYNITGDSESGDYGVLLTNVTNITLRNCLFANFGTGIYADNCSSSRFLNNTITGSVSYGVYLLAASNYNNLTNNTISSNGEYGLRILSSNNTIYNNIFNNTNNLQVLSDNTLNTTKTYGANLQWGSYIGGNLWAKPTGSGFSQSCNDTNVDSICDSSYTTAAGNIDYLPLAVDTTPPNVTLLSPISGYSTTSTTLSLTFNVSDASLVANCSLIVAGSISSTNSSIEKNLSSISFSKTFSSTGSYSWYVNCTDRSNNRGNATARTLTITSSGDGGTTNNGGGGGGGAETTTTTNATTVAKKTETPVVVTPVVKEPWELEKGDVVVKPAGNLGIVGEPVPIDEGNLGCEQFGCVYVEGQTEPVIYRPKYLDVTNPKVKEVAKDMYAYAQQAEQTTVSAGISGMFGVLTGALFGGAAEAAEITESMNDINNAANRAAAGREMKDIYFNSADKALRSGLNALELKEVLQQYFTSEEASREYRVDAEATYEKVGDKVEIVVRTGQGEAFVLRW